MTLIPTLTAVALMACACSVKEDRGDCPCWLKVIIDPFPGSGAIISAWEDRQVLQDLVEQDPGDSYEATVPRGIASVTCFRNTRGMDYRNGTILIAMGNEADSLYAHHTTVDCTGEEATDRVTLNKQFATVYMTFAADEGDDTPFPYDITVRGHVDGMDMSTLEPHAGDFEMSPARAGARLWQFRLPRQKDASLTIDLYRKEDGQKADTLPLGQYIEESGFDWNAESLEDIAVTVDFAKMGLEVRVTEWDADTVYDVTI